MGIAHRPARTQRKHCGIHATFQLDQRIRASLCRVEALSDGGGLASQGDSLILFQLILTILQRNERRTDDEVPASQALSEIGIVSFLVLEGLGGFDDESIPSQAEWKVGLGISLCLLIR